MASPLYFTGTKRIMSKDDWLSMSSSEFRSSELIELKMMNRQELLQLMWTMGIRMYNDLPVIACDDDELRSAYLVVRLERMKRTRLSLAKQFGRIQHMLFAVADYVEEGV